MRPPFSYYGGKQLMARRIVGLMPPHEAYVEPFCGGAAVFFKRASVYADAPANRNIQCLNDENGRIVNFFRVLRDHRAELEALLRATPYALSEYQSLKERHFDPVEDARRWFALCMQSFVKSPGAGFARSKASSNITAPFANRIDHLDACARILQGVCLESADALDILRNWDKPKTLFYCDPPYPGTRQGSYSGYTQEDFEDLIEVLSGIRGAAMLSCYDNPAIPPGWERHDLGMTGGVRGMKKQEVLWIKHAKNP